MYEYEFSSGDDGSQPLTLSKSYDEPSSTAPTRPSSPFSFLTLLADASLYDAKRPRPNAGDTTRKPRANLNSGKSYQCNKCGRTYASTDACRKHARQIHAE